MVAKTTKQSMVNLALYVLQEHQAHDYETGLTAHQIMEEMQQSTVETRREADALGVQRASININRMRRYLIKQPEINYQNRREYRSGRSRYWISGEDGK